MKNIYRLLFFILLIPKIGLAEDNNHAYNKEKNISKTYSVTNDAQVKIVNSYGNVNVYLWDENKISIHYKITLQHLK